MSPGGYGRTLGQSASRGLTQQETMSAGIDPGCDVPAAGASFTMTLQPYDWWRLVAVRFTLTTDANVADRIVTIDYPDGTGTLIAQDGAAVAVTASTTDQVFAGSLLRGVAEWNTGTPVFFPLSGLWLEAGSTLGITVANIQAADQLASIRLTFDRVPVEPLEYGYENREARELNERAER